MEITKQIPLGIRDIRGNEILAYIHAQQGRTWVECRPFCVAMGLAWQSQLEKLKVNPRFTCNDIVTRDSLGRSQEMSCLPAEQLPDWVMSINANKVAAHKREVLLQLQKVLQYGLNELANERYVTSAEVQLMLKQATEPLVRTIEQLTVQLKRLAEENTELRQHNGTLNSANAVLWRARKHEGSSASYDMHATKARKKASKILENFN